MNKHSDIVIIGSQVLIDGKYIETDVKVSGRRIESIGEWVPSPDGVTQLIDGTGCLLVPGLTDMHVHFREPGYSYKETIGDGSAAGAAGGFTTVCTMPNLNPAPDDVENLKLQLELIRLDAEIDVLPYATITRKRMGNELVDYRMLAPWVAGFSDDGSGVQDETVMLRAMEGISKTGKILAAHCEVNDLLRGGYIHDGDYCKAHGHKGICSESEWREVERDIRLAEETGCRLHLCHISTKESVQLIREAKARGVNVTCETAPHYLTFSDCDLCEEGRFKMNPPIRSAEDREALRQGVIDGTIDAIATDHAPHAANEKEKGLEKSAMGVVGLETAYKAVYTTMVASGLMPMARLVEVMSLNPRHILGLPGNKGLEKGQKADLTLLSTEGEEVVDPEKFLTKGRATPYKGMRLKGKIRATISNGEIVHLG